MNNDRKSGIHQFLPTAAIRAVLDQIKVVGKAVEQSGEPVVRHRNVNGIFNALTMQVEDSGDNPAVVAYLLEALEAAVRAYVSGPSAADVLLAVEALRKAEIQRRP